MAGRDSRGMRNRIWAASPGFESRPSDKLTSRCFAGKVMRGLHSKDSSSRNGRWWTLKIDPSIPILKSRRAITSTLTNYEFLLYNQPRSQHWCNEHAKWMNEFILLGYFVLVKSPITEHCRPSWSVNEVHVSKLTKVPLGKFFNHNFCYYLLWYQVRGGFVTKSLQETSSCSDYREKYGARYMNDILTVLSKTCQKKYNKVNELIIHFYFLTNLRILYLEKWKHNLPSVLWTTHVSISFV